MTLSFVPLVAEKILNTVDPINRLKLTALEILDCIGSTNQHLLDQAKDKSSGWVCLAEQQTAGRGRRGRVWFSTKGSSIMCSLLWRFSQPLSDVSSLSLAVGVMLLRALAKYGVQTGIQLKWPNDILYNSRKLAGILLERRAESIVIGFGMNINLPQPTLAERVDLAEIFKPLLVDRTIFRVLNKKEVQSSDFSAELNRCVLKENGKKAFVKAWEESLNETIKHRMLKKNVSYKHLVKLECYKLSKHILDMEEYKPFKMWW